MNNPYRNGKTMSPQMTLLAMVFEAGVRATVGAVREKAHEVYDPVEVRPLLDYLDEVDAMFPKPEEPKPEE